MGALGIWVVCSIATYLVAASIASNGAEHANAALKTSSAQVTSAIQQELLHEEDLDVSASGFVSQSGQVTQGSFAQWAESVEALQRYPEVVDLGFVQMVPASDLASFARAVDPDLPGGLSPSTIQPPGQRSFYCLAAASVSRPGYGAIPRSYDYCDGTIAWPALPIRDSGGSGYAPFRDGSTWLLGVGNAMYRGGITPDTVASRRSAFLGWIGTVVEPDVVLQSALRGHPGIAVRFAYDSDGTRAAFESGPVPSRARALETALDNGWTVTTYGGAHPASVLGEGSALFILIGGVLFGACVGALFLALSTGRYRALRMVEQQTRRLRHQALHDPLTGLPNRVLVSERAEELLRRQRAGGAEVAALYLDLDGFKRINDTLGHEAGDQLLLAVASRLREIPDTDTIGRLGGDEFVVLLEASPGRPAPEAVAGAIIEALREPLYIEGAEKQVATTVSVGIAHGPRGSARDLFRDADVALYEAKAEGKNRFAVFDARMEASVRRRYRLETDARTALDAGQFFLLYQPQYDLADLSVSGTEALLRWRHPEFGVVGPDEFIPILDSSGRILEVGEWVLEEACTRAASWQRIQPAFTVAVNVSAVQLQDDRIVDDVREALAGSGIDPSTLVLEITETTLVRDVDSTASRLQELKALGVQLAIDDFGTGYSSLSYIQRFPLDRMKIDRSFTSAIGTSREADLLLRTLVELGSDLGMRTVAEGVERIEQVDRLRAVGVHEAQGFLLSRPVRADALERQLLLMRLTAQRASPPTG